MAAGSMQEEYVIEGWLTAEAGPCDMGEKQDLLGDLS